MAVKRSFSSAIVYSRRLSKGKVDLMVLFMVDNHCDLFKVRFSFHRYNQFEASSRECGSTVVCFCFRQQIPVSLHKLVSDRIMSIMKGNDPNLTTGSPTLPSL